MYHSPLSFDDYRLFLIARIEASPKKGRGLKSKLSLFINSQTTYLSQILAYKANMNFEQAEGVCRFFGLSKMEKKYFLLLVEYSKAGSIFAREYLLEELSEIKSYSLNLEKRLETKNCLDEIEQSKYYSHWSYCAVHVLCSMPSVNKVADILERIVISRKQLTNVIDFLLTTGLIKQNKKFLTIGPSQLHLADDNHFIFKHHHNWRLQTMLAIERGIKNSLHYSSVVTLNENDVYEIKNQLIQMIKSIKERIQKSLPEEECYSFNIDFFDITNSLAKRGDH